MKHSEDTGASKSHLVSTQAKTSQDLYANIYRLPLKEILQQRREEDTSLSQKKQRTLRSPVEMHAHSDVKTKIISHRKLSIHQPQ